MGLFLLRRFATLLLTLLCASGVVFVVLDVLPGNAAQVLLGPDAAPEAVAELAVQLGLDQPPLQRYGQWLAGLLRGDWGDSYAYGSPVSELIAERLWLTVPLALLAMALATVLALSAGIYAAAHHRKGGDIGVMVLAQIGIAIPNFWFAILLILLFSVQLDLTPVSGRISVQYFIEPVTGFLLIDTWLAGDKDAFWSAVTHLILPMIVLGTNPLAVIARMTRSAMLEVLGEDYIRTARAKGLSNLRVVGMHALRNALIPVITVIGLQVGVLFTGAILTETIFSWPGVGKWMIEAIGRRDYPVLQGGILLLGSMVMLVNLLVDVTYGIINPRIRH